ncbi:TonB family protein [Janthinobacterium sp.]|uniref:energy transducer TonB n=1 Tax=Janthinobacterium sp. TaxID=1871054 RepID=UPI00293D6956|nr:TonB family protein [Janthinobacterium sp.]
MSGARLTGAGAPLAALWRRWGGWLGGAAALAALAGLLWHLLADTAGTKRAAVDIPMLMMPPPAPEPEKLPEPEPEKIRPDAAEPEPAPLEPQERPMDDAPPSPSRDLGDPVTIDGAAQAGGDAFGVQAGRGGGSAGAGGGGGLGSASYARYMSTQLQQALARDPRTRQLAFADIRLDVWLDADGRCSKAELVQGSGNAKADEAVLAMVREMARVDERPPAGFRFPLRVSMKGRRPS